jgi:hypothetical protein
MAWKPVNPSMVDGGIDHLAQPVCGLVCRGTWDTISVVKSRIS